MKRTKRDKQCVYCGATANITRDHVPPKCIFSQPRPSNLISVPSCRDCHSNQTSKDDEYFRLVLHSREDMEAHPDIVRARPTVMRTFNKPEKTDMIRRFIESVVPIEVTTPAGIFIKRHLGFQVDMKRLNRVISRIVKGLFYHERKYRLADSYVVYSQSDDSVRSRHPEEIKFIEENIIKPLLTRRLVTIGQGVFSYRAGFSNQDENFSAWMFVFYQRACFFGLTLPPKSLPAAKH